VHSVTGSGDAVATGVVGGNEIGTMGVPAGSVEYVMQPATDIAAIQMTRSAITFGFIQKPSLQDLINTFLSAMIFIYKAPTLPGWNGLCRYNFWRTQHHHRLVKQRSFYKTVYRMIDP
jgi:hypothetical protein